MSCDSLVVEQDIMLDIALPVPQVQGWVKEHSQFWLRQLEPSSFVSSMIPTELTIAQSLVGC